MRFNSFFRVLLALFGKRRTQKDETVNPDIPPPPSKDLKPPK